MSKIGKMWQELTEVKKNKYKKMYDDENVIYQKAKTAYEEKHGKSSKKASSTKKSAKAKARKKSETSVTTKGDDEELTIKPDPPKRPLNGFMRFITEIEINLRRITLVLKDPR